MVTFFGNARRVRYIPQTMPVSSDLHLGPPARAAKVLSDLSRTPAHVAEIFEDLSHWERIWRPGPDAWNCAEIAGHLLDAEIAFGYRLRVALAEPGKLLDAFDQDAWVATQRYSEVPVEETLATFAALRRNLVMQVSRITDEELGRHYIHSSRGHQTILDLVEFLKIHDARHLVQLGKVSEHARQARPIG